MAYKKPDGTYVIHTEIDIHLVSTDDLQMVRAIHRAVLVLLRLLCELLRELQLQHQPSKGSQLGLEAAVPRREELARLPKGQRKVIKPSTTTLRQDLEISMLTDSSWCQPEDDDFSYSHAYSYSYYASYSSSSNQ